MKNYFKDKNLLITISRYICGIVFIFSGFVKGIDPLGSTYKFADYFLAFNLDFLDPLSLPLAIVLSSLEMLIGIMLITRIKIILASWMLLIFMSFFTILTLLIALTDPVSDCGCFGDALILSNWETFWKNVLLMIFVVHIILNRAKIKPSLTSPLKEWASLFGILVLILSITAYSYLNLPVIDFRPYSVGSNLVEKMSIPSDAPVDEYEIKLFYSKDGVTQSFSVDSMPDSDWEWVRTESVLISEGYQPEITNFNIETVGDGFDVTYDILQDDGYTFILISPQLRNFSGKLTGKINRLANWSEENDINFICLTATPGYLIDEFISETGAQYSFYHTDEITLKTIIRSNPGLILLKEGTILGKWHYRNLPYREELKSDLLSYSISNLNKTKTSIIIYMHILVIIIVVLLPVSDRRSLNDKTK